MEVGGNMTLDRVINRLNQCILFCFCILIIFLPIAHTETIRAFSFGIPACLWVIKMILQRRWLFSKTPLDIPILLFSIVAALSLITAVDFRYSLEEYVGDWLTEVFLFYLVLNNIREDQLKYLVGALLFGNLIMVTYGIYDFFHQGGIIFSYQPYRATSLHYHVGAFGTYLMTVIPYLMVAVFLVRNTIPRLAILSLLSLNVFVLCLAYSRGSWVALVILSLMVGWKFLPKKVFILSLILGCTATFLLSSQGILYYYNRFTVPYVYADGYYGRWLLAKFSLEKIAENPFRMIGYGRRSFVKEYPDLYLKYKGAQLWHAHVTFLNIWLQTGLQGLVFFVFLIYRLLKFCYERGDLEKSPQRKLFLLATFMMVITFFVRNLSDDFFVDDSALFFWFLSGLAVFLGLRSISDERAFSLSQRMEGAFLRK